MDYTDFKKIIDKKCTELDLTFIELCSKTGEPSEWNGLLNTFIKLVREVKFFGGQKSLQKIIQHDLLKRELCEKHGTKLLYFTLYNSNLFDYKVYTNIDDILKEINIC